MLSLSRLLTITFYLFIINIFCLYINFLAISDCLTQWYLSKTQEYPSTYDYIIVGSGSAGSVVAKRLSQDKTLKILVLEAGNHGNALLDIPSLGLLLQKTVYDWQYKTTPQQNACLGLRHNVSSWPMGRIFGGTSKLNNMVYVRGHPQDFKECFNHTYNYDTDILPYFKKLEDLIEIHKLPFKSTLSSHIQEGVKLLNYPTFNTGKNPEGFFQPLATISAGKRWTPSKLLNQNNIIIRTNAIVEKVLFKSNYEAKGVKFWVLNTPYHVTATRGVVLSAGVIGSPKVLMLSGVGPFEHLKDVKIAPKIKLEQVGFNLQDHIATGLDLVVLNTTLEVDLSNMLSPLSIYEYFFRNSGPWTTIGCENIGFLGAGQPQLQIMVLPVGVTSDSGAYLRHLSGFSDTSWHDYFRKVNQTAITILPVVLHPKSRGYVRLHDNNYRSYPVINPNYLRDDYDVKMLHKGIDFIKKLIETEPMQKLGAKLNSIHYPKCLQFQFDTDLYWECYIRHLTLTSYHPIGTCKMGSVVDYNFKVFNTNRLFVVDASVLPTLLSGNINAGIMMMAEKAADSIKLQYYYSLFRCDIEEVFVPNLICFK